MKKTRAKSRHNHFGTDSLVAMAPIGRSSRRVLRATRKAAPCLLGDPHLNEKKEVNRIVAQLLDSLTSVNLSPVSADELNTCIRDLRSKNALGPDGVSNHLLELSPPNLILLLVAIFTTYNNKVIFPDLWKEPEVIGIPMPFPTFQSPSNPSYDRPISLLKTLDTFVSALRERAHRSDVSKLESLKVELALFADDTTVYTLDARLRALTHLYTAIDTLGEWFRKWRIEVNPKRLQQCTSLGTQIACAAVENSCQADKPCTSDSHCQTSNTGTVRAASAVPSDDLCRGPYLFKAPLGSRSKSF
ncbi:hypothetical protein EVAR_93103_1 [Eumeta japonica]|uniref:RNA-directed DNA polymerase from mobile element jockey n=1 Tax=Eumeta variegata TaxID=151549 RepID=A0A4C1TIC0_EUMVA|nr:hypothetical protein EVAR_93103_1 [Eumeta japonica]